MSKSHKGGRKQGREAMRKAGGGRNTLAFYPECHSSWQRQPALPLAAGPQPLPAFMGFMSPMMVLRPGALCQLTSSGLLCRLSRQSPRLSVFNVVGI